MECGWATSHPPHSNAHKTNKPNTHNTHKTKYKKKKRTSFGGEAPWSPTGWTTRSWCWTTTTARWHVDPAAHCCAAQCSAARTQTAAPTTAVGAKTSDRCRQRRKARHHAHHRWSHRRHHHPARACPAPTPWRQSGGVDGGGGGGGGSRGATAVRCLWTPCAASTLETTVVARTPCAPPPPAQHLWRLWHLCLQ